MHISEFEDAYDGDEVSEESGNIGGTILDTVISDLPLRDPIVVEATSTVAEAIQAMNDHHTGCVLVQRAGKLVGIFTERDVLTKAFYRDDCRTACVEEVMTADPESLLVDDGIAFALNKMSVGGYRHIPIVQNDGTPVGVLSVRDIVDFLVELFPQEVLNLPPSSDSVISRSLDGG